MESDWQSIDSRVAQEIGSIFRAIKSLRELHKDRRRFTIDGRLVGDIGEVIAENCYNIELNKCNMPDFDAICLSKGQKIQIKATFQDHLGFKRGYKDIYYLGLKLSEDGKFKEIYNGKGKCIYDNHEHRLQGNNLIAIPIKRLMEISGTQKDSDRIPRKQM